MPRQYSHQFRERVLSLLDKGRRVDDLAQDLGVSAATIYKWRHQARVEAGVIEPNGERLGSVYRRSPAAATDKEKTSPDEDK
ncbi:transposase [Nesterenkonia natronophila]|uniref:Transposase n=1 Tax=Nesterenkonia natronophila TaxID=2174932 RepID=A0A3A4F320_9MICC|nr:transposase [Nesterenkonia natronophila]RJN32131.1 hypothetical protein D3250_08645 [Nesterenkonia natronophila]